MAPNSAQPFASPLSLLLEQRLSPERLSTYVVACTGRLDDALVLYQWNTAVTGAFWEDMAHLEVLLRNAIDDRLTVRHADRGRPGTWLDDPARELTKYAREDIARAKERLRSKRKQFSRGQVVSELSFGFWRFLLSKRHTNLWPDVATGFPYAPNRALATVEAPVGRLHDFRNRLAHHQRVWSEPLQSRHRELLTVIGYICPDARDWVLLHSRLPAILAARP